MQSFHRRDGNQNPDSDPNPDPEIWKPFYRQHQATYELIKYLLAKYWRFMFPCQLNPLLADCLPAWLTASPSHPPTPSLPYFLVPFPAAFRLC